jgi:hypothetical protein
MTVAHRAQRPEWTCIVDSLPWPCADAQESLTGAYCGGELPLSIHMARLMAVAADDLRLDDPSLLYQRFVRWTVKEHDEDEQDGAKHELICCRCGRKGHDLLPGVPLRLFPCRDRGGIQAIAATQTAKERMS